MGYYGKVSNISGNTATVVLTSDGIVTGQLNIAQHITDLSVGDRVLCIFTSQDFSQGVIIAKMG